MSSVVPGCPGQAGQGKDTVPLLKRRSRGESLAPGLAAAAPGRAEGPFTALKPAPALRLQPMPAAPTVPFLGDPLIGSLPPARVIFQSDRGFSWEPGRGRKKEKKKSTIPSQKVSQ